MPIEEGEGPIEEGEGPIEEGEGPYRGKGMSVEGGGGAEGKDLRNPLHGCI